MILKMKNSITQFKTSKGGQNNQGFKTRQRKSEHLAKFNDKLKESIRIGHKKSPRHCEKTKCTNYGQRKKGKNSTTKGIDIIFNIVKILGEISPIQRTNCPSEDKKHIEPNSQGQKRKSLLNIRVKTLNIQNKENFTKTCKKEGPTQAHQNNG